MTMNFVHIFSAMSTYWLMVGAVRPPLYLESDSSGKGSSVLPFHTECERDCGSAPKAYFCGNNGRTYDSECRVLQAKCSDPYLNVTAGKCRNAARCRRERSHILKVRNLPNYTQSANVPSCNKDGSYAPTQCSVYLKYCWCVTRLGELRRNTTFEIGGEIQSCETNGRSRGRRKCNTEADKAAFALQIRSLITNDLPKRSRHLAQSPDKQRDTINRKHNDMDRNHDGSLNNREMRKLLKKYRKKVAKEMRSCIKVFAKYCDLDQNKRVSAAEWGFCLGFQQNSGKNVLNKRDTPSKGSGSRAEVGHGSALARNHTWNPKQPQGTSPSSSQRTCREDRIELLKGHKPNVNIPECTGPNDEFYKQVQCHGAYCYCVVRETGAPVSSTSARKSEGVPNCQRAESPDVPHPIPGCPVEMKEKFLRKVRQLLVSEMYKTGHGGEGDITLTLKERAARWYFDHADKNGDGGLNRNEKGFKKLLNSAKKLSRKCLKKFPQHCDRNKDNWTSLEEFIGCLEVRRPPRELPPLIDSRGSINQLKTTEDPDNL